MIGRSESGIQENIWRRRTSTLGKNEYFESRVQKGKDFWAGGGRRKRDNDEAVTLEKGVQADCFTGAGNLDWRVEL
jgi:hypothetical protein